MLIEAEHRLRRQGVAMWVSALNPEVFNVVQQSTVGRTLGRARMFFNVQEAVRQYERSAAIQPAGPTGPPAPGRSAPA